MSLRKGIAVGIILTLSQAAQASLFNSTHLYGLRLEPGTQQGELIEIHSNGTASPTPINNLHFTWNAGFAFRDLSTVYVTEWYESTTLYGELNTYAADGTKTPVANGIPATNQWPNGSWPTGVTVDGARPRYTTSIWEKKGTC